MTFENEELLISPSSLSQTRRSPTSRSRAFIRIECQAEERHFFDSSSPSMNSTLKPVRLSSHDPIRAGRFRSEIVVNNDPNVDLYIKRLRVAFPQGTTRSSSSSRTQTQQNPSNKRQFRSVSLPRSRSQAILHQWIDDLCSYERLMLDEDIVFFLKNGEFLARI